VLGVQITLWFASGFFMTLFPIDQVRGSHLITKTASPADIATLDTGAIASRYPGDIETLEVARIADRLTVTINGDTYVGSKGAPLPDLSEDAITTVANTAYAGKGELSALALLNQAPLDYSGALPVWQARFDDTAHTRLYIAPQTGELLRVRTRLWRVFDTMWMLHIMDYSERSRFSTWWLRLFSGAALLFAFSGLALVTHRIFLRPKRNRV